MKTPHILWYGAALVVVAIGAIALGAPSSTVLLSLVLLACPAMMMFMMAGGHRHGGSDTDPTDIHGGPDRRDTHGRP